MKRTRKITSIVLAALMVLSALVVSAGGVSAATSSGSEVYFDNSKYGWKDVYVYAYGTKENAEWPGELMTKEDSGLYKASFASSFKSEKSSSTTVLKKAMARSSILRQQVFHLKPANVKCSQPKSSGLTTASLMITLTVTHLQQTIRLFNRIT